MSLRPRFAGNGALLLPLDVRVAYRSTEQAEQDDVVGQMQQLSPDALVGKLSERVAYDPFERVASGLLLAEEFARANVFRHRQARAWYSQYGVLDLQRFFPDDSSARDHQVEPPAFHDNLVDVLAQQRNVRWHLRALVHLSDHLSLRDSAEPDGATGCGWNPRWVEPAIQGPSELLWLGARTPEAAHIGALVQQHAEPEDALGRVPLSGLSVPGRSSAAAFRKGWREARASYETVQNETIPILWAPARQWKDTWSTYEPLSRESERDVSSLPTARGPLGGTWRDLVELERRLLLPYAETAARFELRIERELDLAEPMPPDELAKAPFLAIERRRWTSILAPIYLQLLEALLRVTEGRRGAAFCKECGQPFLTLDARRSLFCTDRERLRYIQRERRIRLGVAVTSQPKPPEP